jgi:hypothetical protein
LNLPAPQGKWQPTCVILFDETLSGQRTQAMTLDSLHERTTAREIIRARIWQEVQEFNASGRRESFKGLVQRQDSHEKLNTNKFLPVDWEKQLATALRAFESNGFFMLVGDRQIAELDEEIEVGPETEVSFVKLVHLVGG